MNELLKYFRHATLPTEPIQINQWITVDDSKTFVDSCQSRFESGDEEGFILLEQYKTALDKQDELRRQESATDDAAGLDQ